MLYLSKKKNVSIALAIIILISSTGMSVNANENNLTGWKKTYYDFMTDYTRLYPDMNSEVIKSGDFGNPDFINGQKTYSEDLRPLYNKTENLKLLNICGDSIPELLIIQYGTFTGDWIGSSTNDTNILIYKYVNGEVKRVFESYENLLEVYYKQTGGNTDVILKSRTPYIENPTIRNLKWNKQTQKLDPIINDELTNIYLNGNGDPSYFEDKGYQWLYYINNDSNDIPTKTIQIEDVDEGVARKHFIEYIDESEIISMLDEYPDEIVKTEEKQKDSLHEKEATEEDSSPTLLEKIIIFLKNNIFKPIAAILKSNKEEAVDKDAENIKENVEEIAELKEKEDLDLDYESSREGFRTYVNNKYGYEIDYPSSFKKDNSKEDTVRFYSQDKKATLTATGEKNLSGVTLSELYKNDIDYIQSLTTIDYKTSSENWYAVSWIYEGTEFYKRVYLGDDYINTMVMESPESEGNIYNPFVEHISLTFKPGNLSSNGTNANNVDMEAVDLTNVKPQIQKIIDEALGLRGAYANSPVSEEDILVYFAQYMFFTDEKIDVIDHYEDGGTSWNVIPKDSVDKFSERYFGKKIIADNHRQRGEIDSGWLEYYYEEQKYYFGFMPISSRPHTTFVVRELSQANENTINAKIDSVINDGMGERIDGTHSIDLERKDDRYIIKNIK